MSLRPTWTREVRPGHARELRHGLPGRTVVLVTHNPDDGSPDDIRLDLEDAVAATSVRFWRKRLNGTRYQRTTLAVWRWGTAAKTRGSPQRLGSGSRGLWARGSQ